jgi:hypothetical protein
MTEKDTIINIAKRFNKFNRECVNEDNSGFIEIGHCYYLYYNKDGNIVGTDGFLWDNI